MNLLVKEEFLQSDNIAIRNDAGKEITYKQLFENAKKLENYIAERSLVFILCDNKMETFEFVY